MVGDHLVAAELAPAEPTEPGVERRAVGGLRGEAGTPCHARHSKTSFEHLRPQGREQHHLFDRVDAGQQPGDAIDADAEPAGRWHAVLEGAQVVLVDGAALDVAGVPGRLLLLEALPLLDRIVELGVAVGQLDRIDEQLEALGEERVVAVDPRQR